MMNVELNSRLDKYIAEFDDDVKLTLSNLKDKSLLAASYQSKWVRYYFQEKTLNQKLKDAKLEYTRSHSQKLSFKPVQMDLDGSVSQDEKLTKLNGEIRNSDMCLDFIEKSMNVLDKFNFSIKNVIDIMRLEST